MVNRKIIFIVFILCSLSCLLPNSLKAHEEYVGTLQVVAIDEIDKITGELRCKYAHYLKTEEGIRYRIEDTEGVLRKLKPSGKIKISGDKIGNRIIVNTAKSLSAVPPEPTHRKIVAATEETAETIGEQKTLVALFNYPDKQDKPFTIDDVKNWILNDTDSVNNFIKENSYDKAWITADFIDFMTLPNNSTYYAGDNYVSLFFEDAITTLDATVNFQDYARLIFFYLQNGEAGWIFGRGSIGKWGMSSEDGDFSASVSWIIGDFSSKSVISHEFGHNLGFIHSASVLCDDNQYYIPETLWDPTSSCGTDAYEEYGDDDTMGSDYKHFSTIWKSQAQWIDSSQIREATNSEYTIDQVELPSDGTKVLKIPLGKDNDGNDFYYWVEYRKSLGVFDNEDVVQVRTKPTSLTGSEWGSNSLRFKKSTTKGDYLDIDADNSFYDPYRGVKIELVEETGSNSDAKVKLKVTMAPLVTTGYITNLESDSATLNGTVNPYGEETTVWFEYGTTSGSYSNTTSTQTVSGSADTTVSIDISSLSENTTYYYRIVAQNSNGTVYGTENNFMLITVTPKIAAGARHSLALKSNGTVWAWGNNGDGQLGDETTKNRTIPAQVSNVNAITTIDGGASHSLALKSDGTVWVWGANWDGQLGDGTNTRKTTPVQISGLSDIISIACGMYHSIALKSDGTVWAFGRNDYGQLGDGTNVYRNKPVQVSGLSDVIAIAGGDYHCLALKSDGIVWAWGNNESGQLGDGTTTNRNTPVQVSSISNVAAIARGWVHSLALKSDETVWAWGSNGSGQLGDGTTTNRTTPVNITNINNIIAIAGGGGYTIALKSDGTGWTCGEYGWDYSENNGSSYWGYSYRTTPDQVAGINDVVAVAGGWQHIVVLKQDGTVWTWGVNWYGQLGDGTTTDRDTPVQVDINLGEMPDTFPPEGSISINSGVSYTNSTSVTLTLSATDATGVTGYYYSESSSTPSASDSGWTSVSSTTSYSESVSYTLSSDDGSKTIYVWYRDAAGNVSSTASDSITRDTTAPTVSITSPTSDATYSTTSSTISLSGSASDSTSGVYSVTWSNNATGSSGMASGTTSWTVSSVNLSNGNNTITIIATDNAGNEATDTVTVTYSGTTLPTPTQTPSTETGTVGGFVTDEDTGAGIEGATVRNQSGLYTDTTDATGYYQIDNIPAGSYTFSAIATGYSSQSATGVVIAEGETTTLDFALQVTVPTSPTPTVSPTPPTATLVVDVTYTGGNVVVGATVTADGRTATTGANGRATFSNLATGDYTVTVSLTGYDTATVDVTVVAPVTRQAVKLSLTTSTPTPSPTPKTATLAVAVSDTDGNVVVGATVTVDGQTATTGANGSATFSNLATGDYTVTVSLTGYDTATVDVTVVAPVTRQAVKLSLTTCPDEVAATTASVDQVSLILAKGSSYDVTITVTDDDDCPAQGVKVKRRVSSANNKKVSVSPTSATTDASGQVAFTIKAKKNKGNANVKFNVSGVKDKPKVKATLTN